MIQIRVNHKKNYMLIVLKGFLKETDVQDGLPRIMKAADALSPGFTIINDISRLSPASLSVADKIGQAQSYLKSKGVDKTIRIVGNVLSKNQFSTIQQKTGADYNVIVVKSAEEALQHV